MSKISRKIKILNWNINGIRAVIKKGFWQKIEAIKPDIFCLQEIKADDEVMKDLYQKQSKTNFENQSDLFSKVSSKNQKDSSSFAGLYLQNWSSCSIKKGYSGVLTGVLKETNLWQNTEFSKSNLIDIDKEGRVLITKFEVGLAKKDITTNNQAKNLPNSVLKIALINAYYPQGGRGSYRIDYKLIFYAKIYEIAKNLRKQGYKIILTGDFNTTVADIDLARPKANKKNTGCLPEERLALSWLMELNSKDFAEYQKRNYFTDNLQASSQIYNELKTKLNSNTLGLVDAFRFFYPEKEGKYTYWDQITKARERNVGWRIDMFLVDKELLTHLKSCEILDQVMGSDHCPIVMDLEI